jgi:hypothetical protein
VTEARRLATRNWLSVLEGGGTSRRCPVHDRKSPVRWARQKLPAIVEKCFLVDIDRRGATTSLALSQLRAMPVGG